MTPPEPTPVVPICEVRTIRGWPHVLVIRDPEEPPERLFTVEDLDQSFYHPVETPGYQVEERFLRVTWIGLGPFITAYAWDDPSGRLYLHPVEFRGNDLRAFPLSGSGFVGLALALFIHRNGPDGGPCGWFTV